MPPQITCPHCGNTINLENRKEVDYEKILTALNSSPRTFSQLLEITDLPRKTLSIRLKNLCDGGTIIKDGGYRLSASAAPENFKNKIQRKNGNGKMNGTLFRVGKNVQWLPVALIVCLLAVSFGSAILVSHYTPTPGPRPPSAVFTYNPGTDVVVGQVIKFDATPSQTTDGYIIGYEWNFGDGTTAVGQTVSHTYNEKGLYTVTLRVTDSKGMTSERTIKVYVSEAQTPPPPPKVIKFTITPNPSLGWEEAWLVNRLLTFDGSEFAANGYTGHQWDFGDGSTGSGTIVSHAYTAVGAYTVTLTLTDPTGTPYTTTKAVTVIPKPATTIYVSPIPSQYNIGDTITLNIRVSDVTGLWSWQTGMTFDPTVLQLVPTNAPGNTMPPGMQYYAFAEGDFLAQGGNTWWLPGTFDNNAGVIAAYGCTLLGGTPVSGSGVLATVTFKVVGEGSFNIHLTNVFLLSGPNAQIPVYVEN
jgi:PKD repeat protein